VRTLTLQAPAKINLTLRVLARRDDGFHGLETLFQAVDLQDTLEVSASPEPGVHLSVEGAELGPPPENLAWRAATAYLQWAGMQGFGVTIRLVKRIPAGAGLGGGSSDAAATLRALGALFGDPLPPERLIQLAAALGSDVPFFMGDAGLALGLGRGEILTPLAPLPEAWVVLGLPPVELSTARMYGGLAAAREAAGGGTPLPVMEGRVPSGWEEIAAVAVNDFEPLAREAEPLVARTLDALRVGDPALRLLSGSGAAVFAVHTRSAAAEAARDAAATAVPETTFLVVPTLRALPGAGRA
jgi:4-diphosphocytidyl-2-C-methyl-D-erythritol kinase